MSSLRARFDRELKIRGRSVPLAAANSAQAGFALAGPSAAPRHANPAMLVWPRKNAKEHKSPGLLVSLRPSPGDWSSPANDLLMASATAVPPALRGLNAKAAERAEGDRRRVDELAGPGRKKKEAEKNGIGRKNQPPPSPRPSVLRPPPSVSPEASKPPPFTAIVPRPRPSAPSTKRIKRGAPPAVVSRLGLPAVLSAVQSTEALAMVEGPAEVGSTRVLGRAAATQNSRGWALITV